MSQSFIVQTNHAASQNQCIWLWNIAQNGTMSQISKFQVSIIKLIGAYDIVHLLDFRHYYSHPNEFQKVRCFKYKFKLTLIINQYLII